MEVKKAYDKLLMETEDAEIDSLTRKKLDVYRKFIEADIYERSNMIEAWNPSYSLTRFNERKRMVS